MTCQQCSQQLPGVEENDLQAVLTATPNVEMDDLHAQITTAMGKKTWPADCAKHNGVIMKAQEVHQKFPQLGLKFYLEDRPKHGEHLLVLGLGLWSINFLWTMGSLWWLWSSSVNFEEKGAIPLECGWKGWKSTHRPLHSLQEPYKRTLMWLIYVHTWIGPIFISCKEVSFSDQMLMIISFET